MELNSFSCQVCAATFKKILVFKRHVHSRLHRKRMEKVFKQEIPHGGPAFSSAFLPYVAVMDLIRQGKHPLIGSCLLTLCFSGEKAAHKHCYLCHVCEEKFPLGSVGCHLASSDHCSNYFSYTNPDAMDFSWIPQRYLSVTLMAETKKEFKQNGPGQLQMLHLPGELMKQVERLTYSEAMRIFIQHDMLLRTIEASRPRRVLIQTYQNDSKRKRPLLGMQHIIECACVGETDKKHYLCTLCCLTFTPEKIIRHILSFDHIFAYFREWHPGTLMTKESYKDIKQLSSMILDLATQTEEIHAKADADIKRVNLEPDKFASTNFKCYSDALKVVESIAKQNDGSSLIASITTGNKLESCEGSSKPESFLFNVYCQDCDLTFKSLAKYFGHVHHGKHKETLDRFARGDNSQAVSCETKGCTPTLHLHTFQKNNLRINQPAVGLSLVVTCLSTVVQNEPVYICFACEESFHQSVIRKHFDSPKHLIRTLLYLNPWRLPFGWDSHMDMKALKSVAWEEEQKRTAHERMLKILDISPLMLRSLGTTYTEVMKRLSLQHRLLKRNVPQRETYRKLKQNERFPLLGEHYLIMYDVSGTQHQSTDEAFLCLLCERSLSNKECHAHVFSREHVAAFLDRFHPGSINSSTDPETLLDLAKQAARVHAVSTMQIIKLDAPICETSSYQEAISLLETAKCRTGKGIVKHPINPKQKLNPRVVSGSAQAKISQEVNKLTQESTCSNEATEKEIAMEVDTQMHGDNAEKEDSKETCTTSGKESGGKGVQSSSVEIKKAGSETSQLFKDRKVEGSVGGKQSMETTGICQSIKKVDETDFAEKQNKSTKDVTTQSKNCAYKGSESKRPRNMSDDGENERNPKRQCSGSRLDGSNEEQQPSKVQLKDVNAAGERESDEQRGSAGCLTASSQPSQEQGVQLWQYIKRKSREPVIGLDAVIECNCQGRELLYLCTSCCLQILEKNIVSHLTAAEHQKVYLMGSQKLPSPPEKDQALNIRKMAALFEQEHGYGEAKVVELDEELYNDIVEKSYKSAMQAVQHLQDDGSFCELSSTSSAVFHVKPEDFSAAPHAQPDVSAATDNLKVGGSEVKPVSVSLFQGEVRLPQVYSCKPTAQLPSETSENVKGNHNATESPSQTTTSHVLPDTTGNELKSGNISTPSVGSSKWETPKYAVDSDCAIKSSNKPMTTPISKCPAEKVTHTLNGSTSAAPTCSVRAAACSSTSSDPAPKQKTCAAATSSASSTTPKQTAAKAASSATSMADSLSTIPKTTLRKTPASPTMAWSPQCENREVSVKTVHQRNSSVDVALNVQKSEEHAASDHMVHIKPENLHTPAELSHFKSMIKPKESKPKVGVDQLIIVTCGEKKQVYCQMCSVRFLGNSHHLHSDKHKMNYVKLKCPGVTTRSTELMEKTVALLAEVDKDSGTCHPQMMAVKMDVYDQLRKLPDDKAIEYVKALKREKNSQVFSTSGTAEDLRLQVACQSPCEASSPNDENIKHETCEVDVQTPTTIETMAASEVKTDEPQSCDRLLDCGSDLPPPADLVNPEPHNQSQPRFNPEPKPQSPPQDPHVTPMDQCERNQDQTRLSTNTPVLENIKQETCEVDVQIPTTIKTMAASEGPVKTDELQSCDSLLDRGSDLPPPANTVNPEPHNQSQPRFNPEPKPQSPPQDPQVTPMDQCERNQDQTRLSTNTQVIDNMKQETCEVGVQTPSTVKTMAASEGPVKTDEPQSCDSLLDRGSDLPPPANTVNPEPHNQSQPRFNPEPKPLSPPQDPHVTPVDQCERNQDQSHLWLTQLSKNTPVIGRGSVWECRKTFGGILYICENCCEVVVSDIRLHLVSETHKINSLVKEYSNFLWFLNLDSTPQDKESLLQKVIQILSKREDAFRITPRVIPLTHSLFKRVRTAPFSNALEIVKTNQSSRRVSCSPDSSQQLQQNARQPDPQRGEPVPVERQRTPPCVTTQRCEGSRPAAAEKPEVAATVSVKDGVKQSRASPQPFPFFKQVLSSHSPLPGSADPQISSQITCRALPVPAEIKPPVSEQLRSVPELQVKQPVVHSQPESLPSSVISPKVIQEVAMSLKDEKAPFARKRSPGTTDSTGTSSPQLEDPLPAKRTYSSQLPSTTFTSKSMSVNPTTSSTHPYSRDQDWRSRSNEMDPSGLNDEMVKGLLRLVRTVKSERKTSELSVPDNARPPTSTTLESCLPNSKAVSTTSSSVNTRPRDPRLQGGVNNQGSSENLSKAAPRQSEATCNPPSQKPPPQGPTVCSTANLPINAIITTAAKLTAQQSAQQPAQQSAQQPALQTAQQPALQTAQQPALQTALSQNRAVRSEGSTSHQFPRSSTALQTTSPSDKSQTGYTTIGQVSGYVLPQATKIYITHGNTPAQRNPQLRATNSEHLVTLVPQGTVRPVPQQQLLQQQWVIQPQKIQPKQVQQQQRVKVSDFFFMEVEQQKQQQAIQQQQIQQQKIPQQPIQQQQIQQQQMPQETQQLQPIQQQFQPQWLIHQQPTQQQFQLQWLIQQQQIQQQQMQQQQMHQQQTQQQLFQPEWQHYATWSKAAPAAGGTSWGAYLTTAPNNSSQEFLNQNVSMRSIAPVQSNNSVTQSVPWLPQTSGHLLSSDSQPSQHVPAPADSL